MGKLGETPGRLVSGGGETGEAEVWIMCALTDAAKVRDALAGADVRSIGPEAFESLRIEAGTPLFGHDVDESVLLSEIPFDNLLSHTKGCYPGQEVVVRIRDRGHVNRMLRGLVLDGDQVPPQGAEVVLEERPDVDQIYMQAVQSLTGHGGWPMTVFLTPDGAPFYGGTYFPPVDRHGLPGFPRLLAAIADAWATRRGEVVESSRKISEALGQSERLRAATELLTPAILGEAFQFISAQFDDADGGLGGAPKFPQPMIWEFVLRYWKRSQDARARQTAHTTLAMMARGGMYDQVGGGCHRYSVDAHWLVPHFEKMLYDNGQLASLYLHGWLAFGDPECRRVCEETLDYILREMTDPAGGFYSSQDADSEGHEGKFFVWTPDELREVLGDADAELAGHYWGVDRGPNFEGQSILYVAGEPGAERIAAIKTKLYAARERRIHPGRDDKVLASWNGLACRAFAEAGRALGRPDYIAAAVKNAEFVLKAMRADGRLLRTWKSGGAKP